jgi:hypothetical protein
MILPLNVRQSNHAHATATCNVCHVTCSALKLPAALEAHYGWKITGTALLDKSEFSTKSALLDHFLSNLINTYVADVRHQLWSKLRSTNNLEVNELNIFCLLLSSGLDYIIEYLKESLSRKGFDKTSTYEFHRFLGIFNLLSSFNCLWS